MNVLLSVLAVLLITPLAFMLCWNGGLSNVIDGAHNMNYVEAFLTTIIPVFLFGLGGARD